MGRLMLILLALTLSVLSLPIDRPQDEAKFRSGVSKEIQKFPKRAELAPSPRCDLSHVKLPQSSEPFPDIPQGQKLLAVAVGRGTQNYTCESESGNTKPKGALATLFDASCIAANSPPRLRALVYTALTQQQQQHAEPISKTPMGEMPFLGRHFFSDDTTAVFDLGDLGSSLVRKEGAVDAPKTALKGVGGQMDGAVAWLWLKSIPASSGKAKTIYRVNTAGGMPPKNCAGQPKEMTVQYSSEYWFYG
ncbi:hypothetical protein DIZ76_017081 [Coccidioides immitis]|nr:hypothetical protein DIZ76_017081 [Coccidioides immitis]